MNKIDSSSHKEDLMEDLRALEERIVSEVAVDNRNKVMDNFQKLANTDGSTNINGMWKLKKKVFPKNPPSLPTAKKDSQGNLISSHEELKKLYLKTYENRLRHRPIIPEMEIEKVEGNSLYQKAGNVQPHKIKSID